MLKRVIIEWFSDSGFSHCFWLIVPILFSSKPPDPDRMKMFMLSIMGTVLLNVLWNYVSISNSGKKKKKTSHDRCINDVVWLFWEYYKSPDNFEQAFPVPWPSVSWSSDLWWPFNKVNLQQTPTQDWSQVSISHHSSLKESAHNNTGWCTLMKQKQWMRKRMMKSSWGWWGVPEDDEESQDEEEECLMMKVRRVWMNLIFCVTDGRWETLRLFIS